MAELADAQDLKSCGERSPYRFDSGPRHHLYFAPVAQWIERLTTDQEVMGSTPIGRVLLREVAQLVEHLVWDQGVAGSNPVFPIGN